jgi:uncharacterized protein
VKDLVAALARGLVDVPGDVDVIAFEGAANAELYRVKVAPGDLGKVIGKKGRTAKALRVLVQAAAAKQGRVAHMEILEPDRPARAEGAAVDPGDDDTSE